MLKLIAQTIPGYEKIGEIDETEAEFTISGRILKSPRFPTASGKAKMFVTPLPKLKLPEIKDFEVADGTQGIVVALMTGRSYAQHNTVVYQTEDKYRGIPHRNCILMNKNDVEKAGFRQHQRVTVREM